MTKNNVEQNEHLIEELTDEELDAADVTGSTGPNKASFSNTGCRPVFCGC